MNTEIVVNNQSLELTEDLSMAFTYSISDIRQPEKRQTDFSKTINVPGTKLNNQIFSHIYQIDKTLYTTNYNLNFTPEFNPNLKATAKVYIDGINVFDGVIQLLNINVIDNTNIMYEVCLFGKLSNIFYNMGEAYLHNLDLSEYDHLYNMTNIPYSWATSIIKNGSTYVNFSGGNPTGEGYVYPMADYGYNNGLNYKLTHFFPAVYVKEYIDKIFDYTGFTYTSSFIDSNFFKRLIIPFNKSKTSLSPNEINARKFYVTNSESILSFRTTDLPLESVEKLKWNNETISPAFDTNNLWNTGYLTNIYKPNAPGYYNLKWSINNIKVQFFNESIINIVGGSGHFYLYLRVWKEPASGPSVMLDEYHEVINFTDVAPITAASYKTETLPNYTGTLSNQFLLTTDKIYFEVRAGRLGGFISIGVPAPVIQTNILLNLFQPNTSSYFYNEPVNVSISEGQTFYMNNAIPTNIKQKDFFTSIIKMFNLFVDVDPENETNLIINPRNDFYTSDVIDWTNKLDTASNVQIKPMGELENKRYRFTYKEDSDHYNTVYKNNNNRIYGDVVFDINNDFLKDENRNELIFSPTPAVSSTLHDRIIPTYLKYDANNTTTNLTSITQKEGQDTNIRILYYKGLVNCQVWGLLSDITTSNSFSYYPYANHLDSPTASTIDLNFGVPLQIFFQTTFYTSNTLYNVYWSDLMGSITDPDSKIVTCYMNLKPTDILQLSFKKLYFIDGNYYRLNKIFDYDPLSVKVTKVEFLKVKKAIAFSGQGSTVLPIVTTYNMVEGGLNEVRDIGATSYYNLIEGGEDEVRDIAATSFYNLVNSGLNTI